MPAWKRICCPIDFSSESRAAMEEAAELAWRFGGALTLVHVDEQSPRALSTLGPRDRDEARAVELERKLASWRDVAELIATSAVECALVTGAPVEEIVRFAREKRSDVIVMATRGQAGRLGWGLGSVAQSVVREAPCTVVVVRGRAAPAAVRTTG